MYTYGLKQNALKHLIDYVHVMLGWQRHCRSAWLAAALPQCLVGSSACMAAALLECLVGSGTAAVLGW